MIGSSIREGLGGTRDPPPPSGRLFTHLKPISGGNGSGKVINPALPGAGTALLSWHTKIRPFSITDPKVPGNVWRKSCLVVQKTEGPSGSRQLLSSTLARHAASDRHTRRLVGGYVPPIYTTNSARRHRPPPLIWVYEPGAK